MNLHADPALSLKGRRELCLALVHRERSRRAWAGGYTARGSLEARPSCKHAVSWGPQEAIRTRSRWLLDAKGANSALGDSSLHSLSARVVSALGLEVPIMQAPVAGAATARLAGEVAVAGGLGSLGASWTEVGVLREQIRSIGRITDRPFCVNLVLDFEQDERLEVAVEECAPIVSFSFGLRPQLVARAGCRRASVGTSRLAGRGASGGRCRR